MDIYSKVIHEEPHREVRLTINEFNGIEYLHLREYYQDFDEEWKHGNKGIGIPLDMENSKQLFTALAEIISLAESKEVIEEFFGETIMDLYEK